VGGVLYLWIISIGGSLGPPMVAMTCAPVKKVVDMTILYYRNPSLASKDSLTAPLRTAPLIGVRSTFGSSLLSHNALFSRHGSSRGRQRTGSTYTKATTKGGQTLDDADYKRFVVARHRPRVYPVGPPDPARRACGSTHLPLWFFFAEMTRSPQKTPGCRR
jgi:hypothetical protein